MASSSSRRQTMDKLARERMLQERRARKQEKKDLKKLAATETPQPEPAVAPAE